METLRLQLASRFGVHERGVYGYLGDQDHAMAQPPHRHFCLNRVDSRVVWKVNDRERFKNRGQEFVTDFVVYTRYCELDSLRARRLGRHHERRWNRGGARRELERAIRTSNVGWQSESATCFRGPTV